MNFIGTPQQLFWQGSPRDIVFDIEGIPPSDINVEAYMRNELQKIGLIPISTKASEMSKNHGSSFTVLVFKEGYLAVRRWIEEGYAGIGIHL